MTRIFTNVPSLTAQRALQTNMSSLQTSLQRLSTGLRINSGKDDPAGLIASEILRSEITGIKQGITNTERANNVIATADSALNEIAGLLNDIRALVNEAANTGAMSQEMLKANQTQVNDMLKAIDRISMTTSFMGRKILDGSLDFEIEGVPRTEIQNLSVTEAQFGDSGAIDVQVTQRQAAEKAALYYQHAYAQEDVELTVGGSLGSATQAFKKGASAGEIAEWVNSTSSITGVMAAVTSDATYGTLVTSSVGPNNDIVIRAGAAGVDAGFVEVKYTIGNDRGLVVDYTESLGPGFPATINVQLQATEWKQARAIHVDSTPGVHDNGALEYIANITGEKYNGTSIHYIDGNLTLEGFADPDLNPTGIGRGVNAVYNDDATAATALLGSVNGMQGFDTLSEGDYIKLIANQAGTEFNNIKIEFRDDSKRNNIPAGSNAAARLEDVMDADGNTSKVLRIYVDTQPETGFRASTFDDVKKAVDAEGTFRMNLSNADFGAKTVSYKDTVTDPMGSPVCGNTHNSGTKAGTLSVYVNTADLRSDYDYINITYNEPMTGFTNFGAGCSMLIEPTKAGYNNTTFSIQGYPSDDAFFGDACTNVLAKYDEKTGSLTVYIRGADNFNPPAAFCEDVSFADIKAAIDQVIGPDGGRFNVTLLGGAASELVDLKDLTYTKPKALPIGGLDPNADVGCAACDSAYIRAQVGYEVSTIRFIAVDPADAKAGTGEYDTKTKEITIYLDETDPGTLDDIAAIVAGIDVGEPGSPVNPFVMELNNDAGDANFNINDAIREYVLAPKSDTQLALQNTSLNAACDETVYIHSDFSNEVTFQFVSVPRDEVDLLPAGVRVRAEFSNCEPHTLKVYLRSNPNGEGGLDNITFEEIDRALRNVRVPTEVLDGVTQYRSDVFSLLYTMDDGGTEIPANHIANYFFELDDAGSSGFEVNNGLQDGASQTIYGVHSANDIKNAFDLDRVESRGNERAAGLFTVWRSRDNDGTGAIHGYQFLDVLKDGQDGGKVLNTAQEVVAALNNSKYWGTEMTQEMLQQWYADGTRESRSDPPVITASLAPGNHGLSTVTPFQEVAYYGNPYEGTGVQFLGPKGSAPIRFVVSSEPNSPLSIDWEAIPDQVDYATAVLSGANANASLLIQGRQTGDVYDDVYFRFVRVQEDLTADPPILRGSGWGEFDSGPSYAEAQLTFNNSSTGNPIANTAFYITANDRGDYANNVAVMMRQNANQEEDILVSFDTVRNELQISLKSSELSAATAENGNPITARKIIEAINKDSDGDGLSDSGFNAQLSFALDANNSGSGTFENLGLTTLYASLGNTGDTGGHEGGTATIYLVGEGASHLEAPTANQIVDIIQNDDILSKMFTASTYTTGSQAGTGAVDFVKDTGIVTTGGITQQGIMVVNLATDANGLPITTAADLVNFWDTLTYEESRGISASLLREPGTIWDECNDDAGRGLIPPTPQDGDECDSYYLDTYFVGWSESEDEPMQYIPQYASGTMTSVNGENSSFELKARLTGADYNGYTLVYAHDPNITGAYEDNKLNAEGTIDYNGLKLNVDSDKKQITVYIKEGVTTANDVKLLIESHPKTQRVFQVETKGTGLGLVTLRDDTLKTDGGTDPPGNLSGAKLLFGRDASDYALEFYSAGYGSREKVSVIANGGEFTTVDANGKQTETAKGTDADVLVNGVKAVADGLNVTLSTSTLSMNFTLNENLGDGYTSNFTIAGGGATFQIGPQVVSNQQITIGIPAVTTISLGGTSGKLYQLRLGEAASLMTSAGTKLADKIVQEAIVSVTEIRGRLGSIQKNTFEPNANVLSDTLEALSAAESEIRDTDFAEETSAMTRSQVLVQASINTLGIANQLPNYILGLLGG